MTKVCFVLLYIILAVNRLADRIFNGLAGGVFLNLNSVVSINNAVAVNVGCRLNKYRYGLVGKIFLHYDCVEYRYLAVAVNVAEKNLRLRLGLNLVV